MGEMIFHRVSLNDEESDMFYALLEKEWEGVDMFDRKYHVVFLKELIHEALSTAYEKMMKEGK